MREAVRHFEERENQKIVKSIKKKMLDERSDER